MSEPINFRSLLVDLFSQALKAIAPDVEPPNIVIERARQAEHGDYACNLAMQLARVLRKAPRDIANQLIAALPASALIEKVEIAGAGFINVFLTASAKQAVVENVLSSGLAYGQGRLEQPQKIQLEFVSANPTGPLHVGHGRGAAYGASLANVLAKAGYDVSREYYVNDAGRQMDILALSTWLRYLDNQGVTLPFPANAYQGEYVVDMALQLQQQYAERFVRTADEVLNEAPDAAKLPDAYLDKLIANAKRLLAEDYAIVHKHALSLQLADCRQDLEAFGVTFDEWFSEQSLFDSGLVADVVELLKDKGHLYQQEGAWWFRSSEFGDEKDRVVQRENGLYTYFASDIAYHLHKYRRGFDQVINIWGADHHGYIPRVKGALQALGQDDSRLNVALVQFAVLYRNGEKVQMSTRSGKFVTLRELRQEVGNDATRFFYVMRKSDQHLDFDLDLAKSQSNDNPVYYIQYAHARICSVLAQWGGEVAQLTQADLSLLNSDNEMAVLQQLMDFPQVIENAARDFAPHLVAFYLKDLAALFHSYYNSTRFLVDDLQQQQARLALIAAIAQLMRNGLALLGVGAPEKM